MAGLKAVSPLPAPKQHLRRPVLVLALYIWIVSENTGIFCPICTEVCDPGCALVFNRPPSRGLRSFNMEPHIIFLWLWGPLALTFVVTALTLATRFDRPKHHKHGSAEWPRSQLELIFQTKKQLSTENTKLRNELKRVNEELQLALNQRDNRNM
jgi:hypothetical protein